MSYTISEGVSAMDTIAKAQEETQLPLLEDQENSLFKLSAPVSHSYGEIFGAPTAYQSSARKMQEFVNKLHGRVFTATQVGSYYVFVMIVGLPLTLAWGLVTGILNFVDVWMVRPAISLPLMLMPSWITLMRAAIRGFLDPIFEAMGQGFKFIKGAFTLNVSGLYGYNQQNPAMLKI